MVDKKEAADAIKSRLQNLHKVVPTQGKVLIIFVPLVLWLLWWAFAGLGYMFSDTEWPEITPSVRAEIDQAVLNPTFNNPAATPAEIQEFERVRGRVLALAIIARLEAELEDGWTPQYLGINPKAHFDNAVNRKLGVLMATTMLEKFFSTNLAKFGSMDPENPWLQRARERDFTYEPRVWGFLERSSVSAYEDGVRNVHRFADKLVEPESAEADNDEVRAIVNINTTELYELLDFILSKNFIDVPLGWLTEPGDNIVWADLDNRVYFSQGVVLVLRDVLTVLKELYPEKVTNVSKGGIENLEQVMAAMDKICHFDPIMVLRGREDSMFADHRGKMARYMFTVRERLKDVAETIRR